MTTHSQPIPNKTIRTPKQKENRVRLSVDVPLLLVTFTLVVFGIVMLYSASWDYSLFWYDDSSFIFLRQLRWVAVGTFGAIFLTFFDYRFWRKLAVPAMLVTILLLAAVLILGEVRNNSIRTFFEGSYQPSELAKIIIIIYLAVWLYAKRDFLHQVGFGLIPLASILGVVGGLIYLQPDLSAVITVVAIGGVLFFLAGGDLRQIIPLMVIGLLVGWLVVNVSATGSARVGSYIEGVKDPTQASYHVRRSMEAFVKGGWFGVGIGKADTKLTGLPVPPTDSIFAVVGEETGVFGSAVILALYGLVVWRGLVIAQNAPDMLGSLLAGGLAIWLGMEAFINMAVIVNLIPFAGNALPLFSAGGSNMLVSLAAIGIMLNVSRMSAKERSRAPRTFVDLSGRHRKYRMARPKA